MNFPLEFSTLSQLVSVSAFPMSLSPPQFRNAFYIWEPGASKGHRQEDYGHLISARTILLGQLAGERGFIGLGGEGEKERGEFDALVTLTLCFRLKVGVRLSAPWWSGGTVPLVLANESGKQKPSYFEEGLGILQLV